MCKLPEDDEQETDGLIRETIGIYPQEEMFEERGHHSVLNNCVEEDSITEAPQGTRPL